MCAFAFDEGPVQLWQQGDPGLAELQSEMKDAVNVPWNCGFERTLIHRVWKLRNLRWRDAMVDALYAGLPAGLKDCNRVPFFASEAQTSKETALINKFCKPQKDGSRKTRETDPEDWELFCQYCKDDVADTRLIFQWIHKHYDIPERVYQSWLIDQEINQRGMPVDRLLTFRAHEEAQRLQAICADDLKSLTGLENPNSPAQLLKWVTERGYPYNGLGKELVLKALKEEGTEIVDD
jgi:DNA polymerase